MLIIKIEERETIEKALKRYKRKCEKVKQVNELRNRKNFKKKSVKKREQLKKAIYLQQKFGDGDGVQ